MTRVSIPAALGAALMLVLAPSALAGPARTAQPPAADVTLNQTLVVSGPRVLLGDLFANAGAKADAVVARAPEPGQRAVFDARWLARVAYAYGLPWRPLSSQDQAVVEREGQLIGQDEVEAVILKALVAKGVDPALSVEVANTMLRVYVAADAEASVAVDDIMYAPSTRRFTAILRAPANDLAARRVRVSGQVHHMTEVPVLARRMAPDESITERDVRWQRVRDVRLQRDTIVDVADLVGQTPRRGLAPGVPLRATDVRRPVVVARGSMVVMMLRTPYMTLTAQGLAQESGADGDTIRVANTHSKTVVDAVVIGPGKVAVRPTYHAVTN